MCEVTRCCDRTPLCASLFVLWLYVRISTLTVRVCFCVRAHFASSWFTPSRCVSCANALHFVEPCAQFLCSPKFVIRSPGFAVVYIRTNSGKSNQMLFSTFELRCFQQMLCDVLLMLWHLNVCFENNFIFGLASR